MALAALLVFAPVSHASDYPSRPIGIMVAYNPGGATDFQARIATLAAAKEKGGKALYVGQPMYVINKPGAGGRKGWNWFAKKAPRDGYMLSAYNVPHFIAQSIVFETRYNIENLEPVGNWGADPAVLIVAADSEFDSIADLINFAQENPGELSISGAGKFVGHHIAQLQFAKAIGADIRYIPAKGGVGALKLVKDGKVKAGFNNLSDSARAGNDIKIFAIADLQRHEYLPSVPTFRELEIDVDNASVNYRGLMVPKGTPASVIDHLSKTVPAMFGDEKTLSKMEQTQSPVHIMTRSQVIDMWRERQIALSDLLAGLKE
ncbi:MAG: tripartite tricarboxylate transporter substrate binding protein [Pseudomonadota bacterium]